MKKSLALSFAVLLSTSGYADESTFLSLTRRPTPVDRLPSNVTVISREQIEASGAQTLDQILSQEASININRTGSLGSYTTLRLRGTPSTAQQLVVIDDQPYGGISADQIVDLSQISTSDIERIEIVRGGSSMLYGANTTGGVIHIITKTRPAQSKEVGLTLQAGSLNTRVASVSAGAVAGNTDVFVTGTRLTTDGFQRNSDADNRTATANIGQSFSNGGRLSLHFANTDNSVGVPQGTAVPISDWNGERERTTSNETNQTEQRRMEGRLKFEQPLGGDGFVQSTFFGSNANYRNHYGAGAFDTPYEKNTHVLGNDTRVGWGNGTTLGLSYERDEYKDLSLSQIHITDMGGYIEQDLTAGRLSVIPALRYDHHSNFGGELNPRMTVVGRVTSAWTLSANASRSFRAPSFFDLYGDYAPTNFVANRNLKPESAWTYDLGNEVRFGESFRVKLTGFYTRIKDRVAQIDPTGDGPLNNTNANISRAELSGAELEFSGQWGPFFDRGNYTFQRAKQNSVSNSRFVDIALTPAHMANYTLGWRNKTGLAVTQTVQYVSKKYELDNHRGRMLPSYGVWRARIAQTIKMVEVFAGVDNIINKRYAETFDFDSVNFVSTVDPLPGRTYYGGINLQFGAGEN